MGLEIEIKFRVQEFEHVRQKLLQAGAGFSARYFEQNLVLDTPQRELKEKDLLLRLRKARSNVLCLKQRPRSLGSATDNPRFKIYSEQQSEFKDPDQLESILGHLGFQPVFRYEKVREKWSVSDCLVCLDLLPFGRYIELEGDQQQIMNCVQLLGLDLDKGLAKTYYELHQEYRQARGWPQEESFVFSEPERSELIEQNQGLC